jgi:hypothetical protein
MSDEQTPAVLFWVKTGDAVTAVLGALVHVDGHPFGEVTAPVPGTPLHPPQRARLSEQYWPYIRAGSICTRKKLLPWVITRHCGIARASHASQAASYVDGVSCLWSLCSHFNLFQ